MHYLVLVLMLVSSLAWSKRCLEYEGLADYLDTKTFIKLNREHRFKFKKEPVLNVGDINQARSYSYRFPAFEEMGFGRPGSAGWTPYISRHPQSPLNGKRVGFEISNEKGHARVRFDWDKEKGAHYNIEITDKTGRTKEQHKVAVAFLCNGQKCTEAQYKELGERMLK